MIDAAHQMHVIRRLKLITCDFVIINSNYSNYSIINCVLFILL